MFECAQELILLACRDERRTANDLVSTIPSLFKEGYSGASVRIHIKFLHARCYLEKIEEGRKAWYRTGEKGREALDHLKRGRRRATSLKPLPKGSST